MQIICNNMKTLTSFYNQYSSLVVGFLGAMLTLAAIRFFYSPLLFAATMGVGIFAVYLAKKVSKHFHHDHHHGLDSAIDMVAPAVLLIANFLHPAVDGFSLFHAFEHEGVLGAIIVGVGILLHEILRQSAMVTVFRPLGIKRFVVIGTALAGILLGVGLGALEVSFLERYEFVADFAMVFAYSFIIAEYYYHNHAVVSKKQKWWGVLGIAIALSLHFFVGHHH